MGIPSLVHVMLGGGKPVAGHARVTRDPNVTRYSSVVSVMLGGAVIRKSRDFVVVKTHFKR